MKKDSTATRFVAFQLEKAWDDVESSFEHFCLAAGIATLAEMMERDAAALCGARYGRSAGRRGYRWGRTVGKLGFHGGNVAVERPRVRAREGGDELSLPSWGAAQAEAWLGRWAMNLMLINVSTRRYGRAVRLPGSDIVAPPGAGISKSAVSRRFVALSAERMREWMASDLSQLDLLAIQVDGLHISGDLTLLASMPRASNIRSACWRGRRRMPRWCRGVVNLTVGWQQSALRPLCVTQPSAPWPRRARCGRPYRELGGVHRRIGDDGEAGSGCGSGCHTKSG